MRIKKIDYYNELVNEIFKNFHNSEKLLTKEIIKYRNKKNLENLVNMFLNNQSVMVDLRNLLDVELPEFIPQLVEIQVNPYNNESYPKVVMVAKNDFPKIILEISLNRKVLQLMFGDDSKDFTKLHKQFKNLSDLDKLDLLKNYYKESRNFCEEILGFWNEEQEVKFL